MALGFVNQGANALGDQRPAPAIASGLVRESIDETSERTRHECFQYPEADLGTFGAFVQRNGQEVLETRTPKSEDSCGPAKGSTPSLLIRRSLVRAQVGEPERLERSRPCRDARPFSLADRFWRLPISRVVSDIADGTTRLTSHSVDQRRARGAMLLRATDSRAKHGALTRKASECSAPNSSLPLRLRRSLADRAQRTTVTDIYRRLQAIERILNARRRTPPSAIRAAARPPASRQ